MRTDGHAGLIAAAGGNADDAARNDYLYLSAILSRVLESTDDELVLVESMECDFVDVLELDRQDAA